MMTYTRQNHVADALNDCLPDEVTWTERCDAAWRAAFPCGIQPKFDFSDTLTVCTEQIVRAGAMLSDDEFEDLLNALVAWVFVSGVPYRFQESTEHIIGVLDDLEPVNAAVLRRVAALNGRTLVEFLGAERTEFGTDHS
jgi:hypothetical protein